MRYESPKHRVKARGESVRHGVWPPKGEPVWLTGDMRSIIALPAVTFPFP